MSIKFQVNDWTRHADEKLKPLNIYHGAGFKGEEPKEMNSEDFGRLCVTILEMGYNVMVAKNRDGIYCLNIDNQRFQQR